MQKNELIEKYHLLRDELDQHCAELYAEHAPHLQCRAGCDMCCMDFNIFPIEFDAIIAQAGEDLCKGIRDTAPGQCPFLIDHRCAIYDARPVICRTQGLPLLFMGDEEWELSVCELNFNDFDWDEFTEDNTFPQDRYNSRLYMLNRAYVDALPGKPYSHTHLLPLSSLVQPG